MNKKQNFDFLLSIFVLTSLSFLLLYGCGKEEEKEKDPTIRVSGISLDNSDIIMETNSTDNLMASITPSNATNKNVSWSSSNEDVVIVDNNGKLSSKIKGEVTITVTTQDGNFSAQCLVKVMEGSKPTVSVESVSLNKNSLRLELQSQEQLIATVSPDDAANKSIIWTCLHPDIAEVTDGKITPIKPGNTTIEVTTLDGGKKAQCALEIYDQTKVTGITLNKTTLNLAVGGTFQLVPTILPSTASNKNVTWSSTNNAVATLSINGELTGKAVGTTKITATTVDGSYKAVCDVTVYYIPVSSISISNPPQKMSRGSSVDLSYSINPSDATNKKVSWQSSNTNVATVSNGKVNAVGVGNVTITVTSDDTGKKGQCTFNVYEKVTGIELNTYNIYTKGSGVHYITATVLPSNATNMNVSWSTSNSNLATVTPSTTDSRKANIYVKYLDPNNMQVVNITATTEDGSYSQICRIWMNFDEPN